MSWEQIFSLVFSSSLAGVIGDLLVRVSALKSELKKTSERR